MSSHSLYSVILLAVAAGIAALVAWYAWRWRSTPGVMEFVLLMAAVTIYAGTSACELAATDIPVKIAWSKLSYIGVVSIAPLWLMFAIRYSQHANWLTHRRIVALWIVPLIVLVLAITNEFHMLVWPTITPVSPEPGALLLYDHGVGVWVLVAYAYFSLLAGTLLLVRTACNSPRLYRWQIGSFVMGALVPWIANLLYLLKLNPWPGLDLTPLGLMVTGLLVSAGIARYHTFDISPVARDVVFNSMGDGVLVLDIQNRLVDINPVALNWTGLNHEAVGRSVFDLFDLNETALQHRDVTETQTLLEISEGNEYRVFELTISPLQDALGHLKGRVALLHDIQHERSLLNAEHRRARQMELLNSITRAALSTPDFQNMIQVLADRLGELFNADGAYLTLWDEAQQRVIPAAAYGRMRQMYPTIKIEPDERTMTQSALDSEKVLVVEDTHNTPYISARIAALFPTTSMMALPLIADGQKRGAVLISFNHTHHFTPEEITLGEQAAGQVAVSIAKAQLFDAESKRIAQLTALQSISHAVVSSLDLQQIFKTVVNVLRDTFKYRYVSIYRLRGETLCLESQAGYTEEFILSEIPINRGVQGRAARTRQPQFIRDVRVDPDYLSAADDIQSEICVPLMIEQSVLGTLNVESTSHHFLVDADLMQLITFAGQVAVAINNARLFQAERKQRHLAEALRIMGMALSESLDIDAVLDRLLDEIGKVVPYDASCVMLVDEANRRAHVARLRGFDKLGVINGAESLFLDFDVNKAENLSWMIETGKPLIIADTDINPFWANVGTTAHSHSWAGAPIVLRGQVIGFLSLDKVEPGFYHSEHADSLAAFTGQAAIAIENARIFSEMQRGVEKERLLFAATRDFTAGLDTEAVLRAIVNHMVEGLGVDGCTVSRWDRTKDCLVTLIDYNTSPDRLVDEPGHRYALEECSLTRVALESRQPHFQYLDDPSIDSTEYARMKKSGNKSLLVLPVIMGRERHVFGVIKLFHRENIIAYSRSDLEIAQNLTAQAAIALENALLYAEKQRLAIVDELTGLYNRRGLFELGQREFERVTRFKHPLAALFLDIDHFKMFNDKYSYAVGDQVLHLFAECVRANLREFDLIGRYGGEEFAVLLPEADLTSARDVAERVRYSVENLRVKTELEDTNITVSIGVCLKTPDIIDLDALLDRAGQAVHEAKKLGRNQVVVY